MNATDQGLVSLSDIADIAGVTRGAVSNWRRREKDTFPQPEPGAGTAAKPLFSRQKVIEWLLSQGRKPKQDDAQTTVWAAMNLLRGELSADQAADLVLSLLLARKNGARVEGEEEGEWDDIPQDLRTQVQGIIDGIEADQLGPVADFALERLAKSLGKTGGSFGFVGSRTTTLLATLAASQSAGVLYDPACGIGTALLEAVALGAKPDRIIGHDINPQALHIAAQRAQLHDVLLELVRTDVLTQDADPSLRAEVIILEPPFGLRLEAPSRLIDPRFRFGIPPRTSADTAWLQHVVAHLSETGRGYVLTPHGALVRGGEEGKIRAELLRRGCVEAIVGLPGKMLPQTAIPLALWVLRHPDPTPTTGQVLFIDASQADTPENRVPGWLTDPPARGDVPHVRVPLTDVLAADSVLTPERWIGHSEPEPSQITTAYAQGWDHIQTTIEQLQQTVAGFEQNPTFSPSRTMTVGELIAEGLLDLRAGKHKERDQDLPIKLRERVTTPAHVRAGTLHTDSLDQAYPDYPELTGKGDLLITTTPTIHAVVDQVGGHLPATNVSRLRVLDPEVLAPGYLAAALTGAWNQRFQAGTALPRAAIRDLEIPLVLPTDLEKIQHAVTCLNQLHDIAARLAEHATTTRTALLNAVRYNVPLTPPPHAVGPAQQQAPDHEATT